MTHYDIYNREERAICSHLFRLLHESLDKKGNSPLGQFLSILSAKVKGISLDNLNFDNVGIYSEVSIIRDAYFYQKPNVKTYMDELTRIVMTQENIKACKLYSELPEILSDTKSTHPKQIIQKADSLNIPLSESERQVFGAIQSMFNAKPDLVITINNKLIVIEAKFTEAFSKEQMKRTRNIAEVWSSLLYQDLGFNEQPETYVLKLGAKKYDPHISWANVLDIARTTYSIEDRTLIALEKGVDLLKQSKLS